MNKNYKYLVLMMAAAFAAGCSDDSSSKTEENNECTSADCGQTQNPETKVCSPSCDETRFDCVDGTCKLKPGLCDPECDSAKQTCNNGVCEYVDPWCQPGTCSSDIKKACPKSGNDAGKWIECAEGEGCHRGVCLEGYAAACTDGTCSETGQKCVGGEWQACNSVETCKDGECVDNPNASCTAGSCVPDSASYVCDAEGKPQKCPHTQVCEDGQCVSKISKDDAPFWKFCSINSDCSFGYCLKTITLSHETIDPNDPNQMVSTISVRQIDSRIPEGMGICSSDCTKNSNICSNLSYGSKSYSCQLAWEADSPYPPKDEEGNALTLPFVNELDIYEMERGIAFGAVCRPFVNTATGHDTSFGESCDSDSECSGGYICADNRCSLPCNEDEECPITFACIHDSKADAKVCKPIHGTYTACRDIDKDGYGVGLCKNTRVDCDDHDSKTFYSTDLPELCDMSADTNCNGRIDAYELLGSEKHCEACGKACSMPSSSTHVSRVCYQDNGGVDFNDYEPETYKFSCMQACAEGYGDCDGNAVNGCEQQLFVKKQELADPDCVDGEIGPCERKTVYELQDGATEQAYDRDKDTYGDSNSENHVWCCGATCYGYKDSGNVSVSGKVWSLLEDSDKTDLVSDLNDCDDTRSAINPKATEICDQFDNNCDGRINEADTLKDKINGTQYRIGQECQTGLQGVCAPGKASCEEISGSYQFYCKGNVSITGDAYELCNGVDDDCDPYIDEGVVKVDQASEACQKGSIGMCSPVYEDGKGVLVDPALVDDFSKNYICKVDTKKYPNAVGKCQYGQYACDASKAGGIYCKPFDPDPFDFAGDGFDSNCDGYDGDYKHTLFVSASDDSINYVAPGSDEYDASQIAWFSNDDSLRTTPLKTLSKAVSLVTACLKNYNNAGCYKVYYPTASDLSKVNAYSDDAACKAANGGKACQSFTLPWDIVVSGGVHESTPLDLAPVSEPALLASKNLWQHDVVITNDANWEVNRTNIMRNNAYWRILGGAAPSLPSDSSTKPVWTIGSSTSKVSIKHPVANFGKSNSVAAIYSNATVPIHLDLTNLAVSTSANGLIDSTGVYNDYSPATLIGLKLNNAGRVTLNNTTITVNAASGKAADEVSVTDPSWAVDGMDAEYTTKTFSDVDDLPLTFYAYKFWDKGKIVKGASGENDLNASVYNQKCPNGASPNFGAPGAVIVVDSVGMEKIIKYNNTYYNFFDSNVFRFRIDRAKYLLARTGVSYKFRGHRLNVDIVEGNIAQASDDYANACIYNYSKYDKGYSKCSYIRSANGFQLYNKNGYTYKLEDGADGTSMMRCYGGYDAEDYYYGRAYRLGSTEGCMFYDPSGGSAGASGTRDDKPLTIKKSGNDYNFVSSHKVSAQNGGNGGNGSAGAGANLFGMMDYNSEVSAWGPVVYPSILTTDDKLSVTASNITDTVYNNRNFWYSDYIDYSHSLSLHLEAKFMKIMYYIHSDLNNYLSDVFGTGTKRQGVLRAASGGAGGCGGLGGKAGYPGGSAIGVLLVPSSKGAEFVTSDKSTVVVTGGNGGAGSDGTPGYAGGKGGSGFAYNQSKIGAAETSNAFPGAGGGGGGAGVGGKGGYALGVVVDCSARNASNFAACKQYVAGQIASTDVSYVSATHGIDASTSDATKATAGGSVTWTEGAAGGTAGTAGKAQKNTTRQAAEVINGATSSTKKVYSNSRIAYIYTNGSGVKLGTQNE